MLYMFCGKTIINMGVIQDIFRRTKCNFMLLDCVVICIIVNKMKILKKLKIITFDHLLLYTGADRKSVERIEIYQRSLQYSGKSNDSAGEKS